MTNSMRPIFILSCERSGSTMLRYIVDTHSKIVCPSHLYLGNVLENINRLISGTIAQTQNDLSDERKKEFIINETRSLVLGVISRYILAKGKEYWCEKTPMNLEFLSILDEHFPNARYICLYRHCMDVVNSSINLSKFRILPEHMPYYHRNPGNIIAAMVENWLDKTETLFGVENSYPNRCFHIKYESIVLHPEETLKSLFEFLDVGWEPDLIDKVFKIRHDTGEGDGKAAMSNSIKNSSVGNGIEVPRSGIPDKFLIRLDELLKRLNYASLNEFYEKKSAFTEADAIASNDINITDIFENRFKNAVEKYRHQYPMVNGVWETEVIGSPYITYYFDFNNKDNVLTKTKLKSDYKITLPVGLLISIVSGRRGVIEPFIQGEITTEGINDKELLMNFGKLIFS